MNKNNFLILFDQSCNFVRLHGWVIQTDEHIERLRALAQEQKSNWPHYISTLQTSIEKIDSVEEKLLILVILSELEVPPDSIADLMFKHLHGRLSSDDSVFITKHFFQNASPVPDEIVYDIIKRNFISYQRAIFQALKVSGYSSSFSPGHVLLFLTQLLCRNNLNEQNRAMLYLLLSRLDIDIPQIISDSVTRAMINLAEIIREVEERLEAVLSDALLPNTITLENIEWDQFVHSNAPAKKPSSAATNATPENLPNYTNLQTGTEPESTKTIVHAPSPTIGNSSNYFSTIAIPPADSTASPPHPSVHPGSTPMTEDPDPLKKIMNPQSTAESTRNYTPAITAKIVSEALPEASIQTSPAPPVEKNNPSPRQPDSSTRLDKGQQANFSIEFNRETEALKAVVQAAHGTSDEPPANVILESQTLDTPTETNEQKTRLTNNTTEQTPTAVSGKAQKNKSWLVPVMVFAGVLTVAIVAWVVSADKSNQPNSVAMPQSPLTPPALPTDDKDKPRSGIAGTPRIESISGSLIWYPQSGDSLWSLYQWLQSSANHYPELQAMATLDWSVFIQKILDYNTIMAMPDIIQPNVPITLHAK